MADQQIEDLDPLTSATIAADDELVVNDVSDTTDDAGGTPKRITLSDLGSMSISAAKTASFTAVQGVMYPVNLSAATANFEVTFPSAVDGATFGFFVATQSTTVGGSPFAQAPYWGVEPLATTSIRKVSYTATGGNGVNKWGLMVNGESLVFRYDAVGATWNVIQDGRIEHISRLQASAQWTSTATSTFQKVTSMGTLSYDEGGLGDTTNDKIMIKRSGRYIVEASLAFQTIAADKRCITGFFVNSAERLRAADVRSRINVVWLLSTRLIEFTNSENFELWAWQDDSTSEVVTYPGTPVSLAVREMF
jgi:hypothetical protein